MQCESKGEDASLDIYIWCIMYGASHERSISVHIICCIERWCCKVYRWDGGRGRVVVVFTFGCGVALNESYIVVVVDSYFATGECGAKGDFVCGLRWFAQRIQQTTMVADLYSLNGDDWYICCIHDVWISHVLCGAFSCYGRHVPKTFHIIQLRLIYMHHSEYRFICKSHIAL